MYRNTKIKKKKLRMKIISLLHYHFKDIWRVKNDNVKLVMQEALN